jgi:hypothetical protein
VSADTETPPCRSFGCVNSAILFSFLWLYLSAAGPGPWSLDARRERREPRDSREDVSIRGVRRSTTLQDWVKTEFKLGRMIPAVYSVKEAEQYSPGLS